MTQNKIHPTRDACFVNFVLFIRDRILTNETQSNYFIPLPYSLIYIGCVKSYSAKFVRNHSLIRYFLHCDWLLPNTDLKVIQGCVDYINPSMSIMFTFIIWHVSRTNQSLRHLMHWLCTGAPARKLPLFGLRTSSSNCQTPTFSPPSLLTLDGQS